MIATDPAPTFGTRCPACFGNYWWRTPDRDWACWGCTPGPNGWQADMDCSIVNTGIPPATDDVARQAMT